MAEQLLIKNAKVRWVQVKDPNYKFNEDGEFSIEVILDEAEHAEQIAEIEARVEASYSNAIEANPKFKKTASQVLPIKDELDDNGDETGVRYIRPKRVHEVFSKKKDKTYKFYIDVFTTKSKRPLRHEDIPEIGNGSTCNVMLETREYFSAKDKEAGVTLDLQAIQIVDLVEFNSRDAESYGFGFEESDEDESPFDANEDGSESNQSSTEPDDEADF